MLVLWRFFRALQEFASAFPARPSSERQNCTESVPEMPSMMEAKDKTIKKFLCTKCNQLCHMKSRQKVKNSDGRYKHPHIPSWVTITSLWDLPKEILDQAERPVEESEERYLSRKTVNFEKLLNRYQKMRENDFAKGKNLTFKKSNIKGKMRKLKDMIVKTKGMTQPSKLKEWIQMYPKVTASKSILYLLLEVDAFINDFLVVELGSFKKKTDIPAFQGQIRLRRKNEVKSARSRRHVVRSTAANSLPEPKEVFQLRERILAFLEESLKESNTDVAEDDFRRLINNLIALVVFRNSHHSGTVSLFRTEYLQNRHESENRKLYAIELAPKDLAEVKKGPGERARIQKIQEALERTHKNFYCEGVKVLGFSDQEMSLLDRFAKLRLTMGKEHKYLFAPLNATDDIDHIDQKVFTKNWARQLPKQHGRSHLSINSTLYRKLIVFYFCLLVFSIVTDTLVLH